MKTWNYALVLSITSLFSLIIVVFLPAEYSIFKLDKTGVNAGTLFPVLLVIWALSLVAFAMNNVFVDKCYVDKNLRMPALLRYLPSVFGIPVFLSFVWFVYTYVKGSALI